MIRNKKRISEGRLVLSKGSKGRGRKKSDKGVEKVRGKIRESNGGIKEGGSRSGRDGAGGAEVRETEVGGVEKIK